MKNLAEQLKLKTYANNGKFMSKALSDLNHVWYEIILQNGVMVVSKIERTAEVNDALADGIDKYGSIDNLVNFFINQQDAKKVMNYIRKTYGVPKELPSWAGNPDIPEELEPVFKSFECYGDWPIPDNTRYIFV